MPRWLRRATLQLGDESYVHDYDRFCVNSKRCFNPFNVFSLEGFDGLLGFLQDTGTPLATINSQSEWVVTFPSSGDPVSLTADEGVFLSSGDERARPRGPLGRRGWKPRWLCRH